MLTLQKQKDKDFVILNFSDTHVRNKYWEINSADKVIVTHCIQSLVEAHKPDLITISGDLASSNQLVAYEGMADFFEGLGVPWAVVWGNHDNEAGQGPVIEAENILLARKTFLYEPGDPRLGRGNYVIGIEEDGVPVEALIMMDSHAKIHFYTEEGRVKALYAKLLPEQIEWYREQIKALKEQGYKESMLYTHIPIFAYKEAIKAAVLKGLDPKEIRYKESYNPIFWNEGYKDSYGIMASRCRTHPYDDGMFDAILEEGHTKTLLCGHDHKNNFVIKHKGVRFAYSMKTGKSWFTNKNLIGGTEIRISSEGVKEIIQHPVDVSHLAETYQGETK